MHKNDYFIITITTVLACTLLIFGISRAGSENIAYDLLLNFGVSIFTIGATVLLVDRIREYRDGLRFQRARIVLIDSISVLLSGLLHQITYMWSTKRNDKNAWELEKLSKYSNEDGMIKYISFINSCIIAIGYYDDLEFTDAISENDIEDIYKYSRGSDKRIEKIISRYEYSLTDRATKDQMAKLMMNLHNINFGAKELMDHKGFSRLHSCISKPQFEYTLKELIYSYYHLVANHHPDYKTKVSKKIGLWLKKYLLGNR